MTDIEFIRDTSLKKGEVQQTIDMDKVESIVNRIKDKYEKEGLLEKVESSQLNELRSIIAEGKRDKVEVLTPGDLKNDFNSNVRSIGRIYSSMKHLFGFIIDKVYRFMPGRNLLAYELYSANINYSSSQYLAMTAVVSTLASLFVTLLLLALFFVTDVFLVYALFGGLFFFFLISFGMLYYPSTVATKRAREIDRELPFALRHMAAELRAGIGLYRVLQSIAVADYGVLSEELAKTISEIEEGTDTKDALKNLALRTKSASFKNALNHLLRAMKTGGNLSDAMNIIAEEVSFDIRMQISSFTEKMNFFGVIYIFIGIVMPVMLAILSGIRNAPLGSSVSFFSALPLTPIVITMIYVILLPLVLFVLVYYIKSIRPAV